MATMKQLKEIKNNTYEVIEFDSITFKRLQSVGNIDIVRAIKENEQNIKRGNLSLIFLYNEDKSWFKIEFDKKDRMTYQEALNWYNK